MQRVLIGDTRALGGHPRILRNVWEGTKGVVIKMRDGLEFPDFNSKIKANPEV